MAAPRAAQLQNRYMLVEVEQHTIRGSLIEFDLGDKFWKSQYPKTA